MKIPSYMKPKYPVLLVAGLGGLFSVVNLAFAQTWTPTGAPYEDWGAVASSADGTKLVATGGAHQGYFWANPLPIYTSTDSGATWTKTSAPNNRWTSVASSADGALLVAVATIHGDFGDGLIYTSPDSGATWTQTSAPSNHWSSVASSADGTKLVAGGQSNERDIGTGQLIGGG